MIHDCHNLFAIIDRSILKTSTNIMLAETELPANRYTCILWLRCTTFKHTCPVVANIALHSYRDSLAFMGLTFNKVKKVN